MTGRRGNRLIGINRLFRAIKCVVTVVGLLTVSMELCYAQQKSANATAGEASYRYETPGIQLEGRLIKRKVFGPPGYGETPARDERDTIFILKLPHPITVEPLPGVVAKSDPNAETFKHVLEVQLFVAHDMASDAEKMVGKLVAATGVLNEHVAPSDYTDVWMAVKAINPK